MSENLPYDDEQWDDLPLPNEAEAWQKMQRLLDEKERRRRILPFWFRRYSLLGMLLAGLATGGYFLLGKDRPTKIETPATNTAVSLQEKNLQKLPEQELEKNKVSSQPDKRTTTASKPLDENSGQSQVMNKGIAGFEKQRSQKSSPNSVTSILTNQLLLERKNLSMNVVPHPAQREEKKTIDLVLQDSIPIEKTQRSQPQSKVQIGITSSADSMLIKDSAEVDLTTPVDSNETQKPAPKKDNPIVFSAGVGLQQAIAFGGQQTSSYNLKGRQNKFSDHIPSVYLRLQKGRWFLLGELHYKVAQPVRPFLFSQVSSYDGASNTVHTERLSVQKLYYHQYPISINYNVLPQWSWGAGVVYNRFAGAVTGQETERRNVLTGSESMTRQVVPVKGYKDSFLYKSTIGFLLQTDYQWGRFSLGLRYTTHLQPFIKYTRPDGAVLNEKNQVLQAILRFRLF